jgi:replication-associated recombination protein RarA
VREKWANYKTHVIDSAFSSIAEYDDLKTIVIRALETRENYNLLFVGPPTSAKTLFLYGREGEYFDCTNTTNRILDVLEEKRPKIICLDELDKMPRNFQEKLLNFIESGWVKIDQKKTQYDFEIKDAKVFATANSIERISKPLQSRFRRLVLPRYTEEQFLHVTQQVLPRLSSKIAEFIGKCVWERQGDIRDVISIGKLVKNEDKPRDVLEIVETIYHYS